MLNLFFSLAVLWFMVWLLLQLTIPLQVRNVLIGVVCVLTVLWVFHSYGAPGWYLEAPRLHH